MIVNDTNSGRDTRTCMDEAMVGFWGIKLQFYLLDNIIDSFKSIVIIKKFSTTFL